MCRENELIILNGRTASDGVGEWTFVSKLGASVFDYVLVTRKVWDNHNFDMQVGDMHESYHFPLEISINGDTDQRYGGDANGSCVIERYRWKEDRKEQMIKKIESKDSEIYLLGIKYMTETHQISDAADVLHKWFKFLMSGLEIRKQGGKTSVNKWFDEECLRKKKDVKTQLRKMRRNSSPMDIQNFLERKGEYKILCENKKREYEEWYVNHIKKALEENDTKKIWNMISSKKSKVGQNCIGEDQWVEHYEELYGMQEEVESHEDRLPVGETDSMRNKGLNKEIRVAEIEWVVSNMKKGKAGGVDGILNEAIKLVVKVRPDFVNIFANLLNVLQSQELYPKAWNRGIICNIYKGKGSRYDANNYRGITLLPNISKIYTKIMAERIQEWIRNEKMLSNYQAGFREGYGACDNLLVIKTLMEKTLKVKRKKMYCCFVDYEKAFDSINRALLWKKLIDMGMQIDMVNVLKSIYKETISSVHLGGNATTRHFRTDRGLRQGCTLSATLFALYINDISDFMEEISTMSPCVKETEIKVLLYADDLVMLANSVGGMNRALKGLEVYSARAELQVNAQKTKMLIVSNGTKVQNNEAFTINSAEC